MSLYLCIFDSDHDDVAGFDVGHYSDFACFREAIARHLPDALERYPVLMQHSDCDGEWTVDELAPLKSELSDIGTRFKALPPEAIRGAFEHVAHCRADATSLYDCFHNVDEENLFESLTWLCDEGLKLGRPISFQ